MNAYVKPVSLKNKIRGKNRRLDPAFGSGNDLHLVGAPEIKKESAHTSVVGKLESGVSMLQIAALNVERIKGWLTEMRDLLHSELSNPSRAAGSGSVVNEFLANRLAKIKIASEAAGFQGKTLINGGAGVKGKAIGDGLYFVRGSGRVVSSGEDGYPVLIERRPAPGILTGGERISSEVLKAETAIALADDSHEVLYHIKAGEDPDSLIRNLQQCILEGGLDISVQRGRGDCLVFRSNQLGSAAAFRGMSYKSRLVSEIPGRFKHAAPGEDIAGMIGCEPAEGNGAFLIGKRGNRRTDGLIVYYSGSAEGAGKPAGHVRVEQNGVKIPLNLEGTRTEILCLPSVQPEMLAVGVSTPSRFDSLKAIRADTAEQCLDALKLVLWSLADIDYLLDEMKGKESVYVNLAMELLRSSMKPRTAGEETISLSKQKAGEMAEQLKMLLVPAAA